MKNRYNPDSYLAEMKLAAKVAAVLLAGGSCGGLGMHAFRDPEIGKGAREIHYQINDDVRVAIEAVTTTPIIWTNDADTRPIVTPDAVDFNVYSRDPGYQQKVREGVEKWERQFKQELIARINEMQAIDDKAESLLPEIKAKFLKEFNTDEFLKHLKLALPDEYLALVTNWHVPEIYLISDSEGFPYAGMYHIHEHIIVLKAGSKDIVKTLAHELVHSGQAHEGSPTAIEGVADLLAMRATGSIGLAYEPEFMRALVQDIQSNGTTTINSFVPLSGEFDYETNIDDIISTPEFKAILLQYLASPRTSPSDAYLVFYMYFKKYLTLEETRDALQKWKEHPYVKQGLHDISLIDGSVGWQQAGEQFINSFSPDSLMPATVDETLEPQAAYKLLSRNAVLRSCGYLLTLLGLLGTIGWAARRILRHKGK